MSGARRTAADQKAPKRRTTAFVLAGLVVALLLGAVVSGFASSSPDGLTKVSEEEGFADTATDHDLADSPVADYGVEGVEDERLSGGLAGIIGVLVTFGVGTGLFLLVRRRDRGREQGRTARGDRQRVS